MKNEKIKVKNVGILGAGMENLALARFLVDRDVKVTLYDKSDKEKIQQRLEKARLAEKVEAKKEIEIMNHEVFFRSPGMPLEYAKKITRGKGKLSSAMQFFFELCPAKIIGVTGTKGKGTTSALIFSILKQKGKKQKAKSKSKEEVYLVGNIGKAPFDIIKELKPDDWVVMEMSSFQLEDMTISPHVAVVLEISPDHLAPLSADNPNYHKNFKDYVAAKRKIVEYQNESDYAIILNNNGIVKDFARFTKAKVSFFGEAKDSNCRVEGNNIILEFADKKESITGLNSLPLPGGHNINNIEASILTAKTIGVDNNMISQVISEFKGLPHRLQLVDIIKGIKYYDDSYATGPAATIAAIKAFNKPIIIILGGSSKRAEFSELARIIKKTNIRAIILIGEEAKMIEKALSAEGVKIRTEKGLTEMAEIVMRASELAKEGDIVLLSPGCASFGLFKNASDRGDRFQEQVKKLRE